MSQLKRNLFLLAVVLFAAKAAYAAVVSIVDTPASSSYGTEYTSSSPSDGGHTSTYSGIDCIGVVADSVSGCNQALGISDAETSPCDGGKFICTCPSKYSESCSGKNEIGSGSSCDGKYQACQTIVHQPCSDIAALYNNAGSIVDSIDECQQMLGDAYTKALICTENGTEKFFCVYDENDLPRKAPAKSALYDFPVCTGTTLSLVNCTNASCVNSSKSSLTTTISSCTDSDGNEFLQEGRSYVAAACSDGSSIKNCDDATATKCCAFAFSSSGYTASSINSSDCSEYFFPVNESGVCIKGDSQQDHLCRYFVEGNYKYVRYQCKCPTGYKTEDQCKAENSSYVGTGITCKLEGTTKYERCGIPCPSDVPTAATPEGCSGWNANDDPSILQQCSKIETGETHYICQCPDSYKTEADCDAEAGWVSGKTCSIGGTVKYEKCDIPLECLDSKENSIVLTEEECKISGAETNVQVCSVKDPRDETKKLRRFWCRCPTLSMSKIEFCERQAGLPGASFFYKSLQLQRCQNNASCLACLNSSDYIGVGYSCDFDALINGTKNTQFIKREYFGLSCIKAQQNQGALTIVDDESKCVVPDSLTKVELDVCYNSGDNKKHFICKCPPEYKTVEEHCAEKYGELSLAECTKSFAGIGQACTFDTDADTKQRLKKYTDIGSSCPIGRPLKDHPDECSIGDYAGTSYSCYDSAGETKYYCDCPTTFDITCPNEGEIRGGLSCDFEGASVGVKYERCLPQCIISVGTSVVDQIDACPLIDGIQATTTETCFKSTGAAKESYVCRCPTSLGYKTLDEYCANGISYNGRQYDKEECLKNFIGTGTVCSMDGIGVNKYTSFALVCPSDRPVYFMAENCNQVNIPGSVDYTCFDRDDLNVQKYVCKCPESWVDIDGNNASGKKCTDNEEASGAICNFEGPKKIKYEKCYLQCSKLDSNGKGIEYLNFEDVSIIDCTDKLGEGATFGTDGEGGQCSRNHSLFSPCYCGKNYSYTCLYEDNEQPAEDAKACTIGGTTYYEQCKNHACSEEGPTTAIIGLSGETDAVAACKYAFGSGATGKKCGNNQAECSCNPREFTETCEYPLTAPNTNTVEYCKYGEGSTLMKSGQNHFKLGECLVRPLLAKCGEYIIGTNGVQDRSPVIYVTETESQCKARYGTGAKTQLCEYSDNADKRAFNCYFNPDDFPITENECPVRHILSKEYVTHNGTKRYKSCDCHSAYKHHRFNCGGILSGGGCTEKATPEMLEADATLVAGGVRVGQNITKYAYCQCPSDYNQVCDGERYIGVGTACNGKYLSCECKKDELPENWVDNYYGCPGGKKPTGVTKPNGCGGKYYQCSVTECTWQHTEKCQSPLIGVDPCQDNQGNIGGYKSCRCPDGYKKCTNDTVGKGEPCILKGEYYYTYCEDSKTCSRGENKTCQEDLLIGVNPCVRNDVTYFEYCRCAAGYDKLCENGEVGVGIPCKLNGKEYFQSCTKPEMTCSAEHRESCNTFQEKYDPCVNKDNKLMYKCKCPSNWSTCSETSASETADTCVASDGTEYYSQCSVKGECTALQEKMYKVCTASQRGTGGSCLSVSEEATVTKYAECEETSACRLNGYKYACQGFDQSVLGTDYCIDENENRLYKECKCPSNWITCPGRNNDKGRSCTALNSDGTSQEPVYERCKCNEAEYKYTCQPTGNNQGITAAKTQTCTPATLENGVRVEGQTLYQSCSCQSSYKYTCTGNGHQIDDNQPYCEQFSGGTKLYEYCACSNEFVTQCKEDSSHPGITPPKDASKICTPANPSKAGYENMSSGSLYTECECGSAYQLKCDGTGQVGVDGCTNTKGETLYKKCTCASPYSYTCATEGENKGIISSGEYCEEVSIVNNAPSTPVKKYAACDCQSEYKKSCYFEAFEDKMIPNTNKNVDYCEASKYDFMRRYKKCDCPEGYDKTCDNIEAGEFVEENASYCVQDDRPLFKSCGCQGSPIDPGVNGYGEWIELSIGNVQQKTGNINSVIANSEFQNKVKNKCKHKENYQITENVCHELYWRCAISPEEGNLITTTEATMECQKQNSKWVILNLSIGSWTQIRPGTSNTTINFYRYTGDIGTYCNCPESYKYESGQSCSGDNQCFSVAVTEDSSAPEKPIYTKNGVTSCSNFSNDGKPALTGSGDSCTKKDGKTFYKECDCNKNLFNTPSSSSLVTQRCLCSVTGATSYTAYVCIPKDQTGCLECNREVTSGDRITGKSRSYCR